MKEGLIIHPVVNVPFIFCHFPDNGIMEYLGPVELGSCCLEAAGGGQGLVQFHCWQVRANIRV